MKIKSLKRFIFEKQLSSIKAGDESSVVVSDQKTLDGDIISAQEILGQIIAADTEDEFKAYFYDKYGSTKFDTETISQMLVSYNEYYKEEAEEEKEEDKPDDEEDELGDIDI